MQARERSGGASGRRTRESGRDARRRRPQGAAAAADDHPRPERAYVTALDGLRAICILGVVLYHMGVGWCQGGLLGVTSLFVLAGYLTTFGVVREFERTGKVGIRNFVVRRIRRLMPSVVVFLVVTAAVLTAFDHVLLTKMRNDLLPALLMVLNWAKILGNESYFAAAGSPSPLTHFWSLAIEFQFYLIWPPILYLLLRHRVGRRKVMVGLGVATIASAVAMALLYTPGVDPSRAYYGTDTRVQSLLLGCALALVAPLDSERVRSFATGALRRVAVEVAAAGSIAVLLVLMVVTRGYTSFSYYGGVLLVGLVTVVTVLALLPEGTLVSRLLSLAPLRWLGQRSFALYLWHYPIVELLHPANSTSEPSVLHYLLILGVSLVVAELSYRLVEQPMRKVGMLPYVRRGASALGAAVASLVQGRRDHTNDAVAALVQGRRDHTDDARATAGRGAARRGSGRAEGDGRTRTSPSRSAPRRSSTASRARGREALAAGLCAVVCVVAVAGLLLVPAESAMGGAPDEERISQASLKKPLTEGVYDVVVVGDSVALNAYAELSAAFPHGVIDAKVSRQASAALEVFEGYLSQGVVGDTVVFSVGTNGALTEDLLDQIVEAVGERELYLVNNRAPVAWVDSNNALIQACADAHDNVHVVDWYGATAGRSDLLEADGTHPVQAGREVFASLLVDAMGYEAPTEENTHYDVVIIGDGVCMAAADGLASAFPGGVVDTADGRSTSGMVDTYGAYENADVVGERVVVGVSASAPLSQDDLDALVEAVGEDKTLWIVNLRVPEAWGDDANELIDHTAAANDNVHVIDWHEASSGHDEYLEADGVHLTTEGGQAYAAMVVAALEA